MRVSADESAGVGKEQGGEVWGAERPEDLPVCFRCGKRRLPIDAIRASSGFYVKGGRARKGEGKKSGEKVKD